MSSFSSYNSATTEENDEAKNLQHAITRIKKAANYVLSKILCKNQNVPKEKMDNVNDTYVKENISDHTLSELSNTQDFLKDKEKSSGTEKLWEGWPEFRDKLSGNKDLSWESPIP